jgi:phosphatidylglycerophosphatase A
MKKNFSSKVICTAMGLGLIPLAPGTFGALGGFAIGYLIKQYGTYPNGYIAMLIVLFLFLGARCSNNLIHEWGEDPSRVVIDEVVGMLISMLFLPNNIIILIASFILFRVFDIFKPLFIKKMEHLPSGWGIMMDDVLAGCYANGILQLVLLLQIKFL